MPPERRSIPDGCIFFPSIASRLIGAIAIAACGGTEIRSRPRDGFCKSGRRSHESSADRILSQFSSALHFAARLFLGMIAGVGNRSAATKQSPDGGEYGANEQEEEDERKELTDKAHLCFGSSPEAPGPRLVALLLFLSLCVRIRIDGG